jgi:hypothetical protein
LTILDKLLEDIGSIIQVQNDGNKSFLGVDLKNYNSFEEEMQTEANLLSLDSSIGLFTATAAAQIVNEKSAEWKQSGKSLNDQVP